MYCANCGKQLPDSAVFCNNCGTKLNTSTSIVPARKEEKATQEVPDRKINVAGTNTNDVGIAKEGTAASNQLLTALTKNKKYIVGALVFLLAVGGGVLLSKFMSSSKDEVKPPAISTKPPVTTGVPKVNSPYHDNAKNNSVKTDTNVNAVSIPPGSVVGAYHSSADQEGSYVHSARLAVDGNTASCWSEGVKGLGIGENIEIHFNGNYKVSGMNIWIGHQKSQSLFYQNARPIALRVAGNDGSSVVYNLQDVFGMQRVEFTKPIVVNKVKLIVERVAPGNKYEDTCIAEVNFF